MSALAERQPNLTPSTSFPRLDQLKQVGNDLVQKQEHEQASKFYERALEIDSTSEAAAAIFSNRSLCYLNMKKYKDALQDAEKAISLRPTWYRGYQRAAAACEKLEKHEEGLKYLEKCFELDEASKNDKKIKQMKEDFEINIIKQKAPSMTQDELKQVGNTFVKNEQYESAIIVYSLAIEKDAYCDAAVPILSNRSLCYFKIEKYKAAYEDGGCCCGIKPDWAKGFMRRGVAAEKLGEWQIALESYDEYLKLDPQDEAGVTTNRKAVAKVVADLKKKEEAKEKELKELDQRLSQINNPGQRLASSYVEFISGAASFDIKRMKIALKQQEAPRLDTPFLPEREIALYFRFLPDKLEEAKNKSQQADSSKHVPLVAELLISFLGYKSFFEKVEMSRQVELLDFILDIVEEQGFSTHPANSKTMMSTLNSICWYDPTSSSNRNKSIRKDLIITLFNRIDTARLLFCETSAKNNDFSTQILRNLCGNYDARLSNGQPNFVTKAAIEAARSAADVCTEDLYTCISMAMQHGANPKASHVFGGFDSPTSALNAAIVRLRSAKVVELLLRYGADPDAEATMVTTVADPSSAAANQATASCNRIISHCTPLSLAFCKCRLDLIRPLLHGKLPRQDLPALVLNAFPPSKNPLVKRQCSDVLSTCLALITDRSLDETHFTHEYLRLLFEAVTNQNLSFLGWSMERTCLKTPLTAGIERKMSIPNLDFMLKLQPDLLRAMTMVNIVETEGRGAPPAALSPLGWVIHLAGTPGMSADYLCSVAQLLVKKHDRGVNVKQEIALCFFNPLSGKKTESITVEARLDYDVTCGMHEQKIRALKRVILGQ